MDDARGLEADDGKEHDAVLRLLSSDEWQRRLEEARQAREHVLANRPDRRPVLTSLEPERPIRMRVAPEPSDTAAFFDEDEAEPEDAATDAPVVIPVYRRPVTTPPLRAPGPPPLPMRPRAADILPPLAAPQAEPVQTARAENGGKLGVRILTGFAIGLVAGVAATSVIWMTRPAAPVIAATPEVAVAAAPQAAIALTPEVTVAAAVQAVAEPAPVMVAPEVLPAAPPMATPVLPGATSLPGPVATAPDILAVMPVATEPAAVPAPAQPVAPPKMDAFDAVIETAVTRPDALVEVRSAPVPLTDRLADLPPLTEAPASVRLLALAAPFGADHVPGAAELPPLPVLAPAISPVPRRSAAALAVPPAPLAVVKLLAPSRLADDEVAARAEDLRAAGYELGDPTRVDFTISATHVRYYHDADREAAQTLAARFDGEARDFTHSSNETPGGTVELWLQGKSPKVVAAKPARTTNRATAAPKQTAKQTAQSREMQILRERILKNLQQGG